MPSKNKLKNALGEIPLTAEVYWSLRQGGGPVDPQFSLERIEQRLPEWQRQAAAADQTAVPGRRVLIFATLRYWIEHAALLGLALAGLGHEVSLAILPYGSWKEDTNRFDLRRQNAYAMRVLGLAEPTLKTLSFLDRAKDPLPADLVTEIGQLALRDTQYTLQVEEVDQDGDLYQMRLHRDRQAAAAALSHIRTTSPDVVITPNGSILEFGAVYAAAEHLGVQLVTYEFGEQNNRIWLAQDAPVMFQETDSLWKTRKDRPLDTSQKEQVEQLFESRQGARTWKNFARRWQGAPLEGAEQTRQTLGLDSRPVALLATNVIGDSLTLGRQVFSESMTEWVKRTVGYFSSRNDCQLIVRIHPGEARKKGPSMLKILNESLPMYLEHVRVIAADSPLNTYDLIATADLGLVYTTTTGLEMVMSGVPAIISGRTHYRGKGFTIDPNSWDDYFAALDGMLDNPQIQRPTPERVALAWRYAYSFFFEYPRPYPWHLLHYWDKLDEWPLERVLSEAGQAEFGSTFRLLAGEQIEWEELLEPGGV